MEQQPDVEMATMPMTPPRDQTPLIILADLAQDIEGIKNASIVYKQIGVIADQLYNIITDKTGFAICTKTEEALVAVHLNIISLNDPPITQTLTGAQQAEDKVIKAIGKIESHYDSQLNQKDEQLKLLKAELLLAHQELRKVIERQ